MKLIIDIPENIRVAISQMGLLRIPDEMQKKVDKAIQHSTPLDKIRAEIEKQEKWLLQAGCTVYNVDIALDAIKSVVAERSGEK